MNKAQLVEKVAETLKTTKTEAETFLDTTLAVIVKSVARGEEVKLVGFGTFLKSKRQARIARNPQTGKEVKLPATHVPKFRPGQDFKDKVK